MPEKRKNQSKDNRPGKKSKTDFMSYMLSDSQNNKKGSDSDDSDDESGGGFSAFDLPNYDSVFNDGGGESEDGGNDVEDETKDVDKTSDDLIVVGDSKGPKPGTSKRNSSGTGGNSKSIDKSNIIFLSDPSQLPNPIMFNTPTVMNPVVLGKPTGNSPSQVILSNKGPKGTVPHIQPVLLSSNSQKRGVAPTQTATRSTRSANNNAVTNKPIPKNYETHVAVPVSKIMAQKGTVQTTSSAQFRGMNRGNASHPRTSAAGGANRGGTSTGRPAPAANALATAAASAVAAGMSATSIMQQVALAAQQAAKSALRPLAMSTPNKQFVNARANSAWRGQAPYRGPSPKVGPIVNGSIRNPNMRNGAAPSAQQNMRAAAQQSVLNPVSKRNGTAAVDFNSCKWKPYSQTLLSISKKVRSTGKIPGYLPGTQPNLKQMYTMLRLKFSTKQIYDMCLWDLEHADASLMEIAIMNAFT